ncbi:hemolysin family protein [Mesorhizobium sp. J428]|uniref:hemolysin family protein n=1 Tax=Mesorhizobium sp. J428 TaxID=2898440 RepID=UPI002150897C|nr:hemolysin family protein [Mesorhizobium sp. J428]MCR5859999.1 hemolysin family protein [Mesorhizobium sp. J428]
MLYVELLLVLVLTLLNGLLAMSELAVVSSRPARLKGMADRGVSGARRALALAADPGKFLSSVQIGITLVGILSGAISGATLGDRLSEWLITQGVPARWAYVAGVGLVVTGITYLSLIVGELVPKQLALKNPERIASTVAPLMSLIATVAAPIVWVLDRSGKLVLALLGQASESEQRVTDEEIRTIVAEAESAGVLEPGEREMIAGVMRLGDRPVRQVMTPRFEVDEIDLSESPNEIIAKMKESQHSRFPVHEGNPDEVIGILWVKDVLDAGRSLKTADLRALVREAAIIPETMDALDVVEILKKSAVHMGLVHDEYGHFQGVVTSSDILEAIVGSFATDEGAPEPAIVKRDDGSLLVAGWMQADEFAEELGLIIPENRGYDTVAGFLIESFGRLPAVGDHVLVQNWKFEIMDLDGRRIDKVLASRPPVTARGKKAV